MDTLSISWNVMTKGRSPLPGNARPLCSSSVTVDRSSLAVASTATVFGPPVQRSDSARTADSE